MKLLATILFTLTALNTYAFEEGSFGSMSAYSCIVEIKTKIGNPADVKSVSQSCGNEMPQKIENKESIFNKSRVQNQVINGMRVRALYLVSSSTFSNDGSQEVTTTMIFQKKVND